MGLAQLFHGTSSRSALKTCETTARLGGLVAPLSGTLPPSISCSLSRKYNESIVHAISTDLNILKNDVRKIKKKCLGFFIVRLSIASMLRLFFRQRLLGSGVLNHDLAGQQNDKGLDDPSREDRLRVGAGQHLKCENSNRPIRWKCRIFSFSCHVRLLNVFFLRQCWQCLWYAECHPS